MRYFLVVLALIFAGCSSKSSVEPDFVYTPLVIPEGVCADAAFAPAKAKLAEVDAYIA
jgi:hypothetical protein